MQNHERCLNCGCSMLGPCRCGCDCDQHPVTCPGCREWVEPMETVFCESCEKSFCPECGQDGCCKTCEVLSERNQALSAEDEDSGAGCASHGD